MAEYIYILSNPSMPGLIKVGKTTTSPNQRMSELRSTGVPTAFILELSMEVADCHRSELIAHRTLAKARLARDREFFRISVGEALKQILPKLGEYKILDARASYGIDSIEAEIKRKREENAKREAYNRAQSELFTRELDAKRAAITAAIETEQMNITRLGQRPHRRELPFILALTGFAFYPIPIGWMFWMGTLQVFEPTNQEVGVVCILLVLLGFFTWLVENQYQKNFEEAHRPFDEIDQRIAKLQSKLETI